MSQSSSSSVSGSDDVDPQAFSPLRAAFGGFLMGCANLVPGVSGGTMILALGLYDTFIGAVARLTSLRWSRGMFRFLFFLAIGLGVSVIGLAGPAVWLVTEHRWIAYSLFIGMTLGGVPLLWRVVRPLDAGVLVPLVLGIAVMAGVAYGLQNTSLPHNALTFGGVGAIAASSMILPGISGSYILLIFGLYDVVVGSLRPSELLDDVGGSLAILVPVLIGVAIGIGLLSNVLKLLLERFERPAHAALLGLLLGSVLGLWPFQEAVHPALVSKPAVKSVVALLEGQELAAIAEETGVEYTADEAAELRERYAGRSKGDLKLLGLELRTYDPDNQRIAIAILLVVAGILLTRSFGRRGDSGAAGA